MLMLYMQEKQQETTKLQAHLFSPFKVYQKHI